MILRAGGQVIANFIAKDVTLTMHPETMSHEMVEMFTKDWSYPMKNESLAKKVKRLEGELDALKATHEILTHSCDEVRKVNFKSRDEYVQLHKRTTREREAFLAREVQMVDTIAHLSDLVRLFILKPIQAPK